MSGVNKVILVGNLGSDPEVRYTTGGSPMARFNIATTDSWTDKEGKKQERTEWHRIVVWGRMSEVCGEYLKKGRQVYIEGRLQTRSWDDKEGQKRYTTEVVAQTVQFLGGARGASQAGASDTQASGGSDVEGSASSSGAESAAFGPTDDDVPF